MGRAVMCGLDLRIGQLAVRAPAGRSINFASDPIRIAFCDTAFVRGSSQWSATSVPHSEQNPHNGVGIDGSGRALQALPTFGTSAVHLSRRVVENRRDGRNNRQLRLSKTGRLLLPPGRQEALVAGTHPKRRLLHPAWDIYL